MVTFNQNKQKIIVERINQKFTELELDDQGLLKDVKESVSSKGERDAKRLQKQEEAKN